MIHPVSSHAATLAANAPPVDANPGQPLPQAATAVTPVQETETNTSLQQRWPDRPDPLPGTINTLEQTLDNINATMQAWSTGMRFDMDEDAQRLVVSIVDNKTGEVLRTVPSEAVIQIAKMIVQLQGNTVDVKA
ncbi:MAG: flagellar protein FlaG [Alcaligenes sp.]